MKNEEKKDNSEIKKELEELKEKITELEKQNLELKQSWQRERADFENYQRRTQTQQQETISFIKAGFFTKIAPVLDNFRLAFKHIPQNETNSVWVTGIKQIEKQLEDILSQEGLEKIAAVGEKFNPIYHEAISYEACADVPVDTIFDEVESGWKFNGKVIKPAKVRVNCGEK